MDSINVFDSPPPEEAYCFIGRFQLHVIPFRCAFLIVALNDTRTCHIHLIACTTFSPSLATNRAFSLRKSLFRWEKGKKTFLRLGLCCCYLPK